MSVNTSGDYCILVGKADDIQSQVKENPTVYCIYIIVFYNIYNV